MLELYLSAEADPVVEELLGGAAELGRLAYDDLLAALEEAGLAGAVDAARDWAMRWRPQWMEVMTQARLAAFLEGMKNLAETLEWGDAPEATPVPVEVWSGGMSGGLPLIDNASDYLQRHRIAGPNALRAAAGAVVQAASADAERASEGAVTAVRRALVQAVRDGGTLEDFREAVKGVLAPRDTENVFRSNVMAAYSDGQERLLADPNVGALFPYAAYHATRDDRTRKSHLQMEKLGIQGTNVYRRDDPVFQAFRPPWSWMCFLPGTVVEANVEMASKAMYSGEVVEVTTAAGRRLTVTGNHPVMTASGFVRADRLREGDSLLCHQGGVEAGRGALPAHDEEQPPARIEDVFSSLADVGHLVRVPVDTDDLHGDGRFCDGHVEVVATDRKLLLDVGPQAPQFAGDLGLAGVDATLVAPAGDRLGGDDLLRTRPPDARTPGGAALALDGGAVVLHDGPLQRLRLGAASRIEAGLRQQFDDGVAGDAEGAAYGEDGLPAPEGGDGLGSLVVGDPLLRRRRPQRGATRRQKPAQVMTADAKLASYLPERHPGVVTIDKIVKVVKRPYSGHVYDLQTATGWIVANGIFCSNCRCVWVPLSVRQAAERGIDEARHWLETGLAPVRPAWVAPPPFPPDADFRAQQVELAAAHSATDWRRYNGPHGGRGWKNVNTGEVRYQDARPDVKDETLGKKAGGDLEGVARKGWRAFKDRGHDQATVMQAVGAYKKDQARMGLLPGKVQARTKALWWAMRLGSPEAAANWKKAEEVTQGDDTAGAVLSAFDLKTGRPWSANDVGLGEFAAHFDRLPPGQVTYLSHGNPSVAVATLRKARSLVGQVAGEGGGAELSAATDAAGVVREALARHKAKGDYELFLACLCVAVEYSGSAEEAVRTAEKAVAREVGAALSLAFNVCPPAQWQAEAAHEALSPYGYELSNADDGSGWAFQPAPDGGWELAGPEDSAWQPYIGKRGPNKGRQVGWQSTVTGEVRYQKQRPAGRGGQPGETAVREGGPKKAAPSQEEGLARINAFKDGVAAIAKDGPTPENVKALVEKVNGMTRAEMLAVKQQIGLKASGRTKLQLAERMVQNAIKAAGAEPPAKAPEAAAPEATTGPAPEPAQAEATPEPAAEAASPDVRTEPEPEPEPEAQSVEDIPVVRHNGADRMAAMLLDKGLGGDAAGQALYDEYFARANEATTDEDYDKVLAEYAGKIDGLAAQAPVEAPAAAPEPAPESPPKPPRKSLRAAAKAGPRPAADKPKGDVAAASARDMSPPVEPVKDAPEADPEADADAEGSAAKVAGLSGQEEAAFRRSQAEMTAKVNKSVDADKARRQAKYDKVKAAGGSEKEAAKAYWSEYGGGEADPAAGRKTHEVSLEDYQRLNGGQGMTPAQLRGQHQRAVLDALARGQEVDPSARALYDFDEEEVADRRAELGVKPPPAEKKAKAPAKGPKPTVSGLRSKIDAMRGEPDRQWTSEDRDGIAEQLASMSQKQREKVLKAYGAEGLSPGAAARVIAQPSRRGWPKAPKLASFEVPVGETERYATERQAAEAFRDITGGISLDKLHPSAYNATDGSKVSVHITANDAVVTSNGEGVWSERYFSTSDGKRYVYNAHFQIDADSPHKGSGARLFSDQVDALINHGVKTMGTFAGGSPEGLSSGGMNGYYTWPRLGYDGEMMSHAKAKLPPELKDGMGDSKSVLKLFSLPGGPEWWKENGHSFSATFDLSPGSPNIKALRRYIAEREERDAERTK